MDMNAKQKENFINMNKTNWTQSTLRELNFLSTTTVKKINSRTQSEIQQDSKKTKKRTQLIIQTNGILKKEEEKSKGDEKSNQSTTIQTYYESEIQKHEPVQKMERIQI